MKGVKRMKVVKPIKMSVFFTTFMSFTVFMLSSCRYRPEPGTVCRSLLLLLDHRGDVGEQLLRVVDDAVLDRVLDAADALDLAGLVVQPHRARAVEHLEVLQRVLIDEHHVREQAAADDAELERLALRFVQRQRAVHRRRLNHFQRVEAGFLQHLELEDVAEAVGLVDEAGVGSGRDAAAHLLVVVHELEPDLVEVAPLDLVLESSSRTSTSRGWCGSAA